MPKAKGSENKENAQQPTATEAKPADYKLEEGKDEESGEESESSDEEEGEQQQPVCLFFRF
jgi:hypothetical protein